MVRLETAAANAESGGVIRLQLPEKKEKALDVLCLGAHSDDIEIGCGGAVLDLQRRFPRSRFHWVVFSATGVRAAEAVRAARLFTAASETVTVLHEFRDGFFPYHGIQLKDVFEDLKRRIEPDLVFTHWQGDAHQDHRVIAEITWNTFRNHLILEYEIPKYDGDLGRPNVFIPLEASLHETKIGYLFDAFESQSAKPWFEHSTFLGLMRLRGMESNSVSGFAEAFHCRKVVL